MDEPHTGPTAVPTSVESFRRWVTVATAPPQLDEGMLAEIVRYRPQDIPAMIEVISEALLACLGGVGELHRRRREANEHGGDRGGGDGMALIVYSEAANTWDGKIRWLQDARRYLARELGRQGGRH